MTTMEEDYAKRGAAASGSKPPVIKPKERTAKVKEPAPAPKDPAVVKRSAVQKTKKQAGYYTTGPNERVTYKTGGTTVRVGPNSTVAPAPKKKSKLEELLDIVKGKKKKSPSNPSGESSVRN